MGWEDPDHLEWWQDVIWFNLASSLLKPKIRDGCSMMAFYLKFFAQNCKNNIYIYIYILRNICTCIYMYIKYIYIYMFGGGGSVFPNKILPEALRPSRVKHLALVAASTKPWVSPHRGVSSHETCETGRVEISQNPWFFSASWVYHWVWTFFLKRSFWFTVSFSGCCFFLR